MKDTQATALALGAFDGLHRGHREVIGAAVREEKAGLVPAVLTFAEDPSMLLTGKTDYLQTREEKEAFLREWGVKSIFTLPFEKVKDNSPREFFQEIVLKGCQAKVLVCGWDFRFGKGAAGNTDVLAALCKEQGLKLLVLPPLLEGGQPVSSTRIRRALENGDAALAERLLGRPFGFSFTVVEGNRIGRTLGTPTINQQLPEGFVMPKFGVYASIVHVDGEKRCGVTNIGVKPTVGHYKPLSETWIPEFQKDMYGMNIRVELVEFIRGEKKFESLDALRAEIFDNAAKAKALCAGRL